MKVIEVCVIGTYITLLLETKNSLLHNFIDISILIEGRKATQNFKVSGY